MTIRFGYQNLFDDAMLTAKSENASFLVENVQHKHVGKKYRATGDQEEWLKFALDNKSLIGVVAVVGHNLSASARVNLYGHDSDLGNNKSDWEGSADYDEELERVTEIGNDIITDGDMESDPITDYWANNGLATFERSNTQARGGTYSAKGISDEVGDAFRNHTDYYYSLTKNKYYQIKFWVYSTHATAKYRTALGTTSNYEYGDYVQPTQNQWTEHHVILQSPLTTASGLLYISTDTAGATFYIDDLEVKEVQLNDPIVVFTSDSVGRSWWMLTIEDDNNSDGYIEIGRVFGGEYFEPTKNFNYKFIRSLVDPSRTLRVEGRQAYHLEKEKYWLYKINFVRLGEADRENFEQMFDEVGNTVPLLVCFDPTDDQHKMSVYGEILTNLDQGVGYLARIGFPVTVQETK